MIYIEQMAFASILMPVLVFASHLGYSGWNYGLNPKGLSMVMTAYRVWWPTLQQVLVYSVYHSLPLSNKVLWVNNAGNIIDGVRGWFLAFEQLYHYCNMSFLCYFFVYQSLLIMQLLHFLKKKKKKFETHTQIDRYIQTLIRRVIHPWQIEAWKVKL